MMDPWNPLARALRKREAEEAERDRERNSHPRRSGSFDREDRHHHELNGERHWVDNRRRDSSPRGYDRHFEWRDPNPPMDDRYRLPLSDVPGGGRPFRDEFPGIDERRCSPKRPLLAGSLLPPPEPFPDDVVSPVRKPEPFVNRHPSVFRPQITDDGGEFGQVYDDRSVEIERQVSPSKGLLDKPALLTAPAPGLFPFIRKPAPLLGATPRAILDLDAPLQLGSSNPLLQASCPSLWRPGMRNPLLEDDTQKNTDFQVGYGQTDAYSSDFPQQEDFHPTPSAGRTGFFASVNRNEQKPDLDHRIHIAQNSSKDNIEPKSEESAGLFPDEPRPYPKAPTPRSSALEFQARQFASWRKPEGPEIPPDLLRRPDSMANSSNVHQSPAKDNQPPRNAQAPSGSQVPVPLGLAAFQWHGSGARLNGPDFNGTSFGFEESRVEPTPPVSSDSTQSSAGNATRVQEAVVKKQEDLPKPGTYFPPRPPEPRKPTKAAEPKPVIPTADELQKLYQQVPIGESSPERRVNAPQECLKDQRSFPLSQTGVTQDSRIQRLFPESQAGSARESSKDERRFPLSRPVPLQDSSKDRRVFPLRRSSPPSKDQRIFPFRRFSPPTEPIDSPVDMDVVCLTPMASDLVKPSVEPSSAQNVPPPAKEKPPMSYEEARRIVEEYESMFSRDELNRSADIARQKTPPPARIKPPELHDLRTLINQDPVKATTGEIMGPRGPLLPPGGQGSSSSGGRSVPSSSNEGRPLFPIVGDMKSAQDQIRSIVENQRRADRNGPGGVQLMAFPDGQYGPSNPAGRSSKPSSDSPKDSAWGTLEWKEEKGSADRADDKRRNQDDARRTERPGESSQSRTVQPKAPEILTPQQLLSGAQALAALDSQGAMPSSVNSLLLGLLAALADPGSVSGVAGQFGQNAMQPQQHSQSQAAKSGNEDIPVVEMEDASSSQSGPVSSRYLIGKMPHVGPPLPAHSSSSFVIPGSSSSKKPEPCHICYRKFETYSEFADHLKTQAHKIAYAASQARGRVADARASAEKKKSPSRSTASSSSSLKSKSSSRPGDRSCYY